MVVPSTFIAAIATPVTDSRKLEGFGRIERHIESSMYVLSIGREKITVRVTEGEGALAVGQRVYVSVRDGRLLIAASVPLAGETSSTANQPYDCFLKSAGFGEGGRPSLGALFGALASGSGFPGDALQCETPLAPPASDPEAIDPEPAREIKRLFTTASSSPAPGDPGRTEFAGTSTEPPQRLDRKRTEAAALPPERVFVTGKSIPEGVYRFNGIEDALAFLGVNDSGGDDARHERDLSLRPAGDGAVVIQTAARGTEGSAALALRPEEVPRAFASLAGGFTSRAFQSIPLHCFEQVLKDRAGVRFDVLRTLDGIAATLRLPAATERAGSREAQETALVQWLHAALEGRGGMEALAATLPAFSAASIVDSLEELSAATAEMPSLSVKLPPAHRIAITEEAIMEQGGGRIFGDMVRRLGCDLERRLALAETADTGSLKAQLLCLARSVGAPAYTGTRPTDETERRTREAAEKALHDEINELERTCLALVEQTFVTSAGTPPREPPACAPRGREDPANKQRLDATTTRREISLLLQTRVAELNSLIGDILSETMHNASSVPRGAPTLPGAAAASRVEALLALLKNDIELIGRRLLPCPEPGTVPEGNDASSERPKTLTFAGRAFSLVETCLCGLSRKLDDFRPQFMRMVETLLNDPASAAVLRTRGGENDEPPPCGTSSPPLEETGADTEDAPSPSRETVRRAVETLLNRVESLQILARQTTTAAGEQHILALPMKIGNEWTEVHVRLVRRRGRKGGAQTGSNVAVFITVAPSLLGAISARMDYHRGKHFTVVMGFESADTRGWFESRKGDLRKALAARGVPSPRIECMGLAPPRAAPAAIEAAAPTAPATTIDVKA